MAHEGSIFQPGSTTFAVWVNVINGEIVPNEVLFTFGIFAAAICCGVPNYAALGIAETAFRIFFRK